MMILMLASDILDGVYVCGVGVCVRTHTRVHVCACVFLIKDLSIFLLVCVIKCPVIVP